MDGWMLNHDYQQVHPKIKIFLIEPTGWFGIERPWWGFTLLWFYCMKGNKKTNRLLLGKSISLLCLLLYVTAGEQRYTICRLIVGMESHDLCHTFSWDICIDRLFDFGVEEHVQRLLLLKGQRTQSTKVATKFWLVSKCTLECDWVLEYLQLWPE